MVATAPCENSSRSQKEARNLARIHSFLQLVVEQDASDLHFHAGNKPLIRFRGDLIDLPFRVLSKAETARFVLEIMTPAQREQFQRLEEVDFIYELPGVGRFRANVFRQKHGVGAVFRVIPFRIPTLKELLFPETIRQLTRLSNGLVLVSGPTGCGKSTTLAAMVHAINQTSRRHIITIEDPIEFVHHPLHSTITHRQVGKHAQTFAQALRSALRESPDVIVVGEMRDAETMALALSAAETGVLVLATLHTNSASKAVNRIIDSSPPESREHIQGMLSFLLKGVISQRLCKRADGEGRIALLEILLQNFAVSNMIRENKIHMLESYLKTANTQETGMQHLDRCIFQYVEERLIDEEEGLFFAHEPQALKALIDKARLEAAAW